MNNTNTNLAPLEPVRFEESQPSMTLAGLSERYSFDAPLDGSAQWKRFASHIGNIPGQKGTVTYGVCFGFGDGEHIEYMCGVEVSGDEALPDELTQRHIPAQHYAVFVHEGHVSDLRQTLDAISKWMAESDVERPDGVNFFFERYDERFDSETGTGVIEIWMPVEQT